MIYVFKTSVRTKKGIREFHTLFDEVIHGVKWNFDLADRDKILRIESQIDIVDIVKAELNARGYECEELE